MKKTLSKLSVNDLKENLSYSKQTGLFTWLKQSSNRAPLGSVAGCLAGHGYIKIGVLGTNYYAHRLAWLYCNGNWPEFEIDHIDGNRSNNRIDNLRDITPQLNLQNLMSAHVDSKSGLLGAYAAKNNKWVSRIYHQKRMVHLGIFDTKEEAHAAYIAAKRMLHIGNML